MNATTKRTLLTFGAVVLGSATQIPGLMTMPLVGLALTSFAGFLAGWAHMDKPADK